MQRKDAPNVSSKVMKSNKLGQWKSVRTTSRLLLVRKAFVPLDILVFSTWYSLSCNDVLFFQSTSRKSGRLMGWEWTIYADLKEKLCIVVTGTRLVLSLTLRNARDKPQNGMSCRHATAAIRPRHRYTVVCVLLIFLTLCQHEATN